MQRGRPTWDRLALLRSRRSGHIVAILREWQTIVNQDAIHIDGADTDD